MRAVAAPTPEAACARHIAAVRARQAHRAANAAPLIARSVEPGDALPAGAARAEVYRGEESAARRVIEVAGPIVARASSWADLHAALADHGMAYRAKGSGAVFVVDGLILRASTCRAASRAQLEKRLGPFQPGPGSTDARVEADHPRARAAVASPGPAPGIAPELFAVARREQAAARAARDAYDATDPALNDAPLLKAALVGPAPRAAPSARTLARRHAQPLPRLAPLRTPSGGRPNLTGLLELYHRGLQADRYRVVAERPRQPAPRPADGRTSQDDRLVQLTPRSMAEIAAGWTALERAGGTGSAVYLMPISDARHHVVLSGLGDAEVARLRVDGFTPALVAYDRRGRYEVALSAARSGKPHEAAAVAAAAEDLRLELGVGRGRFGLRLDDPDPERDAGYDRDDHGSRAYAQIMFATGATCAQFGRLIQRWIDVFARRFGLGQGSVLGRHSDRDGADRHAQAPLYWAHRTDLLERWQGRWPDPSRIDALVARRLRGTGHGEDAVADVITACAPLVPRIGRHAWTGYGRRVAAHAFRDDADARGRLLDGASPAMWLELEQAVRKRADATRPTPPAVPVLPAVPLAEPPPRRKAGAGATNKGRRSGGRGDDWWD